MAIRSRLTRREQQEQLRERILDAALGVFRRTGFAKATIQEIADLAGCTRGSVYLHFGSKEDLWVAVAEEHVGSRIAAFREKIEAAESDAALVALLATLGGPSSGSRVPSLTDTAAVVDGIRDSHDEDLLKRVHALQLSVDAVISFLIERLCALRGVEPPVPPTELGILAVSLRQGLVERGAIDVHVDVEARFAAALDLLLSGTPGRLTSADSSAEAGP